MATKPAPMPRFMTLGKSKFVHVVRTKTWDLKESGCQQVRKFQVAGNVKPSAKGISPEAALALDPCPNCGTDVIAKEALPPEVKKQAKRDQRDDVMKRAKESTQTKAQAKKAGKRSKAAKPAKERVGKPGARSAGGTDSKAKALAQFAEDHGWTIGIKDGDPGVLVEAMLGNEIIRCFFVDGKYDTVRFATLSVGDWSAKLRGVHSCRRQIAGEGRDRPYPNPGVGRSGPRKGRKARNAEETADGSEPEEGESPEDAKRRVPFSIDDEPIVIIDAIKGKVIKWRNGMTEEIEEAWLPADPKGKKVPKIRIEEHPKTGRRIITFMVVTSVTEHGEQYGVTRSVFLDKIIRVS